MTLEPKSKTGRLCILAKESASSGKTIMAGYAIRALADMWSNHEHIDHPTVAESAEDMWNSYFAVRKMYSLEVDFDWSDYYRNLSFWKKYKAKRNEAEWKRNHRIQLENEAETAVLSIIDDTDYRRIYGREV